ncbi:sugar transferase [Luedemannella helvata]|uniref:Sugar transferase n=1 Tax=Luedemannella helvata TaxID=349315 RepID=A0ABP4WZ63_9ACTN
MATLTSNAPRTTSVPTPPASAIARVRVVPVRTQIRAYQRTLTIVDTTVVALAVIGGYLARFQGQPALGSKIPYAAVAAILFVVWLAALRLSRAYDDHVIGFGADEYRRVVSASLKLAGSVAIIAYLADVGISRGFLGITFAVGTAGLASGRFIARKSLHRRRRRNRGWSRRVLVVGDASHVLDLVEQLRSEPLAGYTVVGACIPDSLVAPVAQHLNGVPVVGSFRTIIESARAIGADTIAVTAAGELTGRRLRRLGWQLESTDIDLVLAPALTDVAGPRIHTRPIAGLPLIHVEAPEFSGGRKVLKGAFDRSVAALVVLLASPALIALALAVKLTSRGPVIYKQKRVGIGGKEFSVYKFRSMVVDAEKRLADLQKKNETDGLLFKMRDDPRVTKVGKVLRRWSLDELPQLFNVLFGHMSLVGPRPPLPTEVARYDQDIARRLLVKPGMTGLWQVSGRSDLSFEDGIRLDLYYVENWSLAADMVILWRTVGAVVASRGAY